MKPRRRIAFSKAQDHASSIAITAGIYDGRNGVLGSQCETGDVRSLNFIRQCVLKQGSVGYLRRIDRLSWHHRFL
jgi:hypothetical protein